METNKLVGLSVIRKENVSLGVIKRFLASSLLAGTILSCGETAPMVQPRDGGAEMADGATAGMGGNGGMGGSTGTGGVVGNGGIGGQNVDGGVTDGSVLPAYCNDSKKISAYVLHTNNSFFAVKDGDAATFQVKGMGKVEFTLKTENGNPFYVSKDGKLTIDVVGNNVTGLGPIADVIGHNLTVTLKTSGKTDGATSKASFKVSYVNASGRTVSETATVSEGNEAVFKTAQGEVSLSLAYAVNGTAAVIVKKANSNDAFEVMTTEITRLGLGVSTVATSDLNTERYKTSATFEVTWKYGETDGGVQSGVSTPTLVEGDSIICGGGVTPAYVDRIVAEGNKGTVEVKSTSDGMSLTPGANGSISLQMSGENVCSATVKAIKTIDSCIALRADAGADGAIVDGGMTGGNTTTTSVDCANAFICIVVVNGDGTTTSTTGSGGSPGTGGAPVSTGGTTATGGTAGSAGGAAGNAGGMSGAAGQSNGGSSGAGGNGGIGGAAGSN